LLGKLTALFQQKIFWIRHCVMKYTGWRKQVGHTVRMTENVGVVGEMICSQEDRRGAHKSAIKIPDATGIFR